MLVFLADLSFLASVVHALKAGRCCALVDDNVLLPSSMVQPIQDIVNLGTRREGELLFALAANEQLRLTITGLMFFSAM